MTFSLLRHFPYEVPRSVFASTDLPAVDGVFRRFNVWILNHGCILLSMLPSVPVTLIFSAAFAMLLGVPENVGWTLLAFGLLVLINSVYCHYHYAADGLAGIAVSLAGLGLALAHGARTGGWRA